MRQSPKEPPWLVSPRLVFSDKSAFSHDQNILLIFFPVFQDRAAYLTHCLMRDQTPVGRFERLHVIFAFTLSAGDVFHPLNMGRASLKFQWGILPQSN